jgi:hypothetical protein
MGTTTESSGGRASSRRLFGVVILLVPSQRAFLSSSELLRFGSPEGSVRGEDSRPMIKGGFSRWGRIYERLTVYLGFCSFGRIPSEFFSPPRRLRKALRIG